jgi:outer membrane protein assembly factor BamB
MTNLLKIGLALMLLLIVADAGLAADWPEWRGKGRLAVWNEEGILDQIPEDGLKTSWRVPIGSGYSGPVVSRGRVVTMDYLPKPDTETAEAIERVICLDEQSGKLLWKDEWQTHYRELMGSYRTGPRATPTIDGDRVYAVGAAGHIRCLRLDDGKLLWSKDSRKEFKALLPVWGISTAPIIDGDLVIFATGGQNSEQVRAFNKLTGEEVWKAVPASYELGYSQFVIYEHAGVRQLIYWDPQSLRSLNPQTGETYWDVPMTVRHQMTIATPVKSGSRLLVSSFYSGSMLVEMDTQKPTAKKLWHIQGKSERPDGTDGLHSVITTPIVQGDHFYGTCSHGEMRGLELASGKRVWENKSLTRQGRWGSAYFVRHQDRYFMVNDEGELLIVRLSPKGVEEVGRTLLIKPDTESGFGPRRFANSIVNWCHPAFANGHILIRNDHEMVRVSLQASPQK